MQECDSPACGFPARARCQGGCGLWLCGRHFVEDKYALKTLIERVSFSQGPEGARSVLTGIAVYSSHHSRHQREVWWRDELETRLIPAWQATMGYPVCESCMEHRLGPLLTQIAQLPNRMKQQESAIKQKSEERERQQLVRARGLAERFVSDHQAWDRMTEKIGVFKRGVFLREFDSEPSDDKYSRITVTKRWLLKDATVCSKTIPFGGLSKTFVGAGDLPALEGLLRRAGISAR